MKEIVEKKEVEELLGCEITDEQFEEALKYARHKQEYIYQREHRQVVLQHAILLTREKTLPNISALMNTLMETDAKERVSKELLLEAIDDFEKDNIDSRECISEWKSKVAAETEMITKKAMKKILNMRTGIASKFNRFLHEK